MQKVLFTTSYDNCRIVRPVDVLALQGFGLRKPTLVMIVAIFRRDDVRDTLSCLPMPCVFQQSIARSEGLMSNVKRISAKMRS